MGASSSFMQHLVGVVLLTLESGTVSQAAHLAMETLINIAGRVDLTGRKRMQGYFFSEDALRLKAAPDAVQRNLMKLRMCRDLSTSSYVPYMTAATSLLSAVTSILCADAISDRTLTLRAVELLGRVASNADNSAYLASCPQELLDSIVQLLCASTSFTEPLVSDVCKVNGDPLGRRRPPASVHLTTRALAIVAAATPAPATGMSGGNAGSSQQLAPSGYEPAAMITFNGVRADAVGFYASAGTGIASSTNLAGMSAHSSSGALAQRTAAAGGSTSACAQPSALLTAMTPVAPYFVDGCDQEMRDTVIDALHALATPSVPMQARLAQCPRLVQFLLRISRCYNNYNPAGGVPGLASGPGSGSASNFGVTGGIHRAEAMIKALQVGFPSWTAALLG
jgi:hypothetical protein